MRYTGGGGGSPGNGGDKEESVRTLNTGVDQHSQYRHRIRGSERIGVSLGRTGILGCSECGLNMNENTGFPLQLFLADTAHMVLCPSRRGGGEEEGCG